MEVTGLFLVVLELTRVQRQQFGTPLFIQKARARVLRLLGRRRTQTITGLGGLESAEAFGGDHRIVKRKARTEEPTQEERIAALEADVEGANGSATSRRRRSAPR